MRCLSRTFAIRMGLGITTDIPENNGGGPDL